MTELISVTVSDGKYTVRQTAPGRWEALRYGEEWPAYPDGPGNLAIALAYEIHELREKVAELQNDRQAVEEARRALTIPSKYGHSDVGDRLVRYFKGEMTLAHLTEVLRLDFPAKEGGV